MKLRFRAAALLAVALLLGACAPTQGEPADAAQESRAADAQEASQAAEPSMEASGEPDPSDGGYGEYDY